MSNRTAALYYVLAIVGLLATWYFNLQYFIGGGSIAPGPFFASAFANPLTTAITVDIYWAALVFSVWTVSERGHPGAPRPWLYVVLCFGVGLAFAFPLYLARRAQLTSRQPQALESDKSAGPAQLRGTV